jgi:3-hydroxyisobutyrate dehydrogenase-like beta-hydroxyacid dehydrogenase
LTFRKGATWATKQITDLQKETHMKERIGFIGVGLMGHGMAKNIVEKGWPLTVLAHRKREAVDDLMSRGAQEAASPRAVADASDIVVLCVTGSPQVEAIVQGPDGLASAGKKLMIVDCSTSEPASTRRLAETLAPKEMTLIDAPLSRTPKDAWEGTLDVMVGGDPEAVKRARPVLEAFAGRVVDTGPVGTGHTMKLLNNFLSMGYAAIYSEALMVGAKAGLAPAVFDSVISGGRMDCPFYQTFRKYVIERDRNAHRFTLANALKDVSYLAGFAQALGVANPVGAAVRNSFAQAVATGHGEAYVPMLSDHVAEWNGTSLAPSDL